MRPRLTLRRAAPLPVSLLAVLALASGALGAFTPALTLRTAPDGPLVTDLSASGENVAASWSDNAGRVKVRTSSNSGTTFGTAEQLASDPSKQASGISLASDAASQSHFAVWAEEVGFSTKIFLAQKSFSGPIWGLAVQVPTWPGNSIAPSVAVSTPYLFVTYLDLINSVSTRGRIQIYDRQAGTWLATPIHLPGEVPGGVRLTASFNRVLLTWRATNGDVKVRRGTFSGASIINWTTTTQGSGRYPIVVMSGAKACLVWTKSFDVYAAKSTNGGASWTALGKVLDGSLNSYYAVDDAAITGSKVAFVGVEDGDDASANIWEGHGLRMESANLGTSWTKTTSHPNSGDWRQVAFTIKPSNAAPTLAEAWTDKGPGASFRAKYHRKT